MDADSGELAEQVLGVTSEVLRLFKPIGLRAWSFWFAFETDPLWMNISWRGTVIIKVGVFNC